MAHIVIVGAGIGGLPTAFELRHLLSARHQITLVSESPRFTFIPSLPWVALGLKTLAQVQVEIQPTLRRRGVAWRQGAVLRLEPRERKLWLDSGPDPLDYDYLMLATGADLNTEAIPGLGPEGGYSQSVCNPRHAQLAAEAWQTFLAAPGPIVVGAAPGASCLGPLYEFALLADWRLRRLGLRERAPISIITPEPFPGHLGIGGMANSQGLVETLLQERGIAYEDNQAITALEPGQLHRADGAPLPFQYAMIIPAFRGPAFLRNCPEVADAQGFVPTLPGQRHPEFASIYALGLAAQLPPLAPTPIPTGIPKTGQMTEAMGLAAAQNIAVHLGEAPGNPVTPTLAAICLADFGDRGIVFLADPVLPDPQTGLRRQAMAAQGAWVSWAKTLFEQFFLLKMRLGWGLPWFEKLGLNFLGLQLLESSQKPRN